MTDEMTNGSGGTAESLLSATSDAAVTARATAERAAAKLPDALAGMQSAASTTQHRIDEMPDGPLLVGAGFSLGLGAALFATGANRLLVLLSMVPLVAIAISAYGRGLIGGTKKPAR